jgi:hypothetical protein
MNRRIAVVNRSMPKIRAIVFDSNVFGKNAQPNIKTIEQWADACEQHEAQLWIAEIVVHELAQHVVEAHEEFMTAYDTHRRALAKWGMYAGASMSPINAHDISSAIAVAGARLSFRSKDRTHATPCLIRFFSGGRVSASRA